jgi:glucosamine--fructose-6-phosphate aminotransferase (isomerizing)
MISNIEEIKARNGRVIGVGTGTAAAGICDDWIEVPRTAEMFSPLVTVVPLQLLAYYVAFQRGCEIDQPRNLAKSVTVE